MVIARALVLLCFFGAQPAFGAGAAPAVTEQSFIDLFAGAWAGPGTLVKAAIPWRVTCRATGQSSTNRLIVEGSCSLAIINDRIAADIAYDPKTGLYSGTYIGAKVGPARVSGRRSGSVLSLAITWPHPVFGDTRARMTIVNTGGATFRLTIFDNIAPGGPEELTSDVVMTRL